MATHEGMSAERNISNPGLFLVKKALPKPPRALVKEALDSYVCDAIRPYADQLAVSRAFWRARPDLVESEVWEPHIVAAFESEAHYHPSDETVAEVPDLGELRRRFRRRAEDLAQAWVENGVAL